jgi:hypothetical protein
VAGSQVLCFQPALPRISLKTGRTAPSWRILRRVNARPSLKDAIRIRQMREWRMRATCPLLAKGYPAWKCRKNYLYLVRTFPSLAQRAGYRESDVYR